MAPAPGLRAAGRAPSTSHTRAKLVRSGWLLAGHLGDLWRDATGVFQLDNARDTLPRVEAESRRERSLWPAPPGARRLGRGLVGILAMMILVPGLASTASGVIGAAMGAGVALVAGASLTIIGLRAASQHRRIAIYPPQLAVAVGLVGLALAPILLVVAVSLALR